MSFKEAIKRYQTYIPTAIIAVCTWVFSNIGTAVIAAITDFNKSYGQMKTDIKQNTADIVILKANDAGKSSLISHLQERELSSEKRVDDYNNIQDKRSTEVQGNNEVKFAQIFTTLTYIKIKN